MKTTSGVTSGVYQSLQKVKQSGELDGLLSTSWDVIVIGSGMGGMAAAASLAKAGRRVLVLEQHYVAGGFTHTFSRKGYTWDVGVHCLGQMKSRELPGKLVRWLSDDQVEMASLGSVYDSFYFPDGFKIDFPDSKEQFKKNLEEAFPSEKQTIEKYLDMVREVNQSAKKFFALRTLPGWASSLASKVIDTGEKRWWSKTTAEVLQQLTSNKKLQAVLAAQWGYYSLTPSQSSFGIHAVVTRHFWNGGYYPVGGSKVFADRFLETVQKAGGATIVRASVAQIIVRKNRAVGVRLESGEEFFAKKIISAGGAKLTVEQLLPEECSDQNWIKEIISFHQSPPHVCVYLGLEGDIEKAGATKANQWFFETWNMEEAEWNVEDPHSIAPVLYTSFPSLKDPHHNPGPENKHTGESLTFVPWKTFEKWSHSRRGLREKEYMEFKKTIEDRILKQLEKHRPEIMKLVRFAELSTPLSTTHFTKAPQGGIYGLEASPRRFSSKALQAKTPIKGLYLAGGDVASLGVTGALMGGVLAAVSAEPKLAKHLMR